MLFCAVMLLSPTVAYAASVRDFLDFSTTALPGRLYVPPGQDVAVEPRPLILFLHGAGETGRNNISQINGNIDNLLTSAKMRDTFLYAPQATTYSWSSSSRTETVMSMVDRAISEFNVDADRVYVTGLSMGGGGTWNMLNRYADRFAAGVPIAGVNPAGDFNPANFQELPTWAFHARNDGTVNKNSSRNRVNQILDFAGETRPIYPASSDFTTTLEFVSNTLDLRYTEWPTGGHGIWGRVYNEAAMYDWMFSQTLAVPEPSGVVLLLTAFVGSLLWRRPS
jgi:predicted peptidase